jgi:hypothetical protein
VDDGKSSSISTRAVFVAPKLALLEPLCPSAPPIVFEDIANGEIGVRFAKDMIKQRTWEVVLFMNLLTTQSSVQWMQRNVLLAGSWM